VRYADDYAVVISAETREVCEMLEKVILHLNRWFKSNNLLMNLGKTHFMPIRKSYVSTHCWELKHFDTKTVTQKGSHKFLGVIVDQFFKWKENTEKLVSELRSLGYVFRKLVKYSVAKTIKTAYYGHVNSNLNYGILALGFT